MEPYKSNSSQGLGIAALVLGVITLVVAFIPCIGTAALIPGIVAIVLSIVALNQANQENSAKGLVIAALVIAIVGTTVATLWSFYLGNKIKQGFFLKNQIEHAIEEETGKSVDESIKDFGKDMEVVLKNLEDSVNNISIHIEIKNKMSGEEFDVFLNNYEKLIQQSIKYKEMSKTGDSKSIEAYTNNSLKIASLLTKIATSDTKLTSDQAKRLKEINKKYEKDLDALKEE